MLNIPDNIKQLFLSDNVKKETRKKYKITFFTNEINNLYPSNELYPNNNLFPARQDDVWFTIENDKIVSESLNISESLSSDEDLKFGSCESAKIEIIVADVSENVVGYEFVITLEIDGTEIPLGRYIVKQLERQTDHRKRKIIGYDYMSKFDVDVSGWYKSLEFPMTLKEFRKSLINTVGIQENPDVDYLPNDDIILTRNADIAEISGRDLICMIEEINGVFGHIDKTGVFQHVYLCPTDTLYPSSLLFPDNTTYPSKYSKTLNVDLTEITGSNYQSFDWDDYVVKSIDSLIILGEDGSSIASYGDGENAYIIEDNFLLWDMTNTEMISIAYNIFGMISGRSYVPIKSYKGIGLPWVEVGDSLEITTREGVIKTYILSKSMSGTQALKDEYGAEGNEIRTYDNSISRKFTTFKNKANATFKVMNDEIDMRVTYGDVVNAINISQEGITIQANKISLEGIVTANSYFKILEDGSMEAVNGKFSGDITGTKITGGTLTGTNIFGGDNIPFKAEDGEVSIGDFYVADEYGRHIFQSIDECTGMSTGDAKEGEWYLWAGYGKGSGDEQTVFIVNDGQVRVEGELILNGRNIMDIIQEEGGCASDCDDTACGSDEVCPMDGCTLDGCSDCADDPTCTGDESEGPGCML